MSFKYKEIKRIVRFKEQDNNEIRFSDYDIKMAVNEVIRYLSNSLADSNSDFNEKIKVYDEAEMNEALKGEVSDYEEEGDVVDEYPEIRFKIDGVDFPDDFISIVAVKRGDCCPDLLEPCTIIETPKCNQYKVVGDKLYVGVPHFELIYKASIKEVVNEEDEIELPNMFKDNFVQLVRMVINAAEVDIMRDAVDNAVQILIPKRRYRNAKIPMPFYINGYRGSRLRW